MAILPIRAFPDRVLKNQNHDALEITPQLRRFISDLIDTMTHHPRCVGLAAPQTGLPIRLFVIDGNAGADEEPELSEFKKVFINLTGDLLQRYNSMVLSGWNKKCWVSQAQPNLLFSAFYLYL